MTKTKTKGPMTMKRYFGSPPFISHPPRCSWWSVVGLGLRLTPQFCCFLLSPVLFLISLSLQNVPPFIIFSLFSSACRYSHTYRIGLQGLVEFIKHSKIGVCLFVSLSSTCCCCAVLCFVMFVFHCPRKSLVLSFFSDHYGPMHGLWPCLSIFIKYYLIFASVRLLMPDCRC
jgi:hypothetical protein